MKNHVIKEELLMKCKVIRQREKERRAAIEKATAAIGELNPHIEFSAGDEQIYTSCKTPTDLLEIELPDGIIKIGDPEDSAVYGFIHVKIGDYKVFMGLAGVY